MSSFSDGLVLEESFELLVEDIHEPPHSVVLSKSSIDEGLKSGSVVAQLTAVDPDRDDQIQFTLPRSFLSSTDNDQFSIVDNNLIINSIPDFESNSEYNLVVRASDSFGLFSDHNIKLTVNDVNEAPSEVFVNGISNLMRICRLVQQSHNFPVMILISLIQSLLVDS